MHPILLYRGESFDANFYHHCGLDMDHSFLVVEGAKKTLLVPRMNESLAKASFRGRVAVYTDAMKELAGFIGKRTVLIDGSSISAAMASHLKRFCRLKDYSQGLLLTRAKKRSDEAGCVGLAARYTKEIIASLDFRKAKTELDIKKQLLLATFELGFEPAFDPIVATGRNTSYPHYRGGNRKLDPLVLVDYGVRYRHYCADITRCFILDGDRKKKEQYERLQDVCHFLADALPGLERGKDVARLAEELMARAGFPKMLHSIGHGVGLDIHELPSLGKKSQDKLAGATLAIEPAFYLKDYGMRYEETVWFDGRRTRIL
jgi:Xaa-Pro dipeptidase